MAKWKIGITGGIGSGKTYCARFFGWLGIPVYYADERARNLMQSDPEVRAQLIELLGTQTYDPNGVLQKDFMRKQVFENKGHREAINAIVHPAVAKDYEKWHRDQTSPYTLKEAALLVEAGSYKTLDHLIMVNTPLVVRTQRIMARDSLDQTAIQTRMNSQLPDRQKEALSDLFIDNSGCYPVLPQILHIHRILIQKRLNNKL